jgi:cytoplasmic iron level regulating protein YaaA (DUF328/UPF0246 family)
MLIVLSPAKALDTTSKLNTKKATQPDFLSHSRRLIKVMRKKTPVELARLMKLSDNLAELNHKRFAEWKTPFCDQSARPAALTFNGPVYLSLNANTFTGHDFNYAQKHLRILSGLYGLLRPLDLMMPYRLEMGAKVKTEKGSNLYDFWGPTLAKAVDKILSDMNSNTLINLASNEYFKSIDNASLQAKVVTPVFKDLKNGRYKVLSFFAKKARGSMASYLIKNRVKSIKDIKEFANDGYTFQPEVSSDTKLVFHRDAPRHS